MNTKMDSLNVDELQISNGLPAGEANTVAHYPVLNLDYGDPTMFEPFWRKTEGKSEVAIPNWESLSYFSGDADSLCWYMVPKLAEEIKKIHALVGNANTKDRHIVVGTGSTQLFQAALYALSPSNSPEPTSVLSAVPYYSPYPLATDVVKSGLYKWAGDAASFKGEGTFIEIVTSPNNPDGLTREPVVVGRSGGKTIYDLAYYWPHYTPITSPCDQDLMLFTISKATGHAGIRIGWALVKDEEVAKKMTEFIILASVGVSRDSQIRAANILSQVLESYKDVAAPTSTRVERLFSYGRRILEERCNQLREVVNKNPFLSLPIHPSAPFCNFFGEKRDASPCFAWLKVEGEGVDAESILRSHNILTRAGPRFGASKNYVRLSVMDTDEIFTLLIQRLSTIFN